MKPSTQGNLLVAAFFAVIIASGYGMYKGFHYTSQLYSAHLVAKRFESMPTIDTSEKWAKNAAQRRSDAFLEQAATDEIIGYDQSRSRFTKRYYLERYDRSMKEALEQLELEGRLR